MIKPLNRDMNRSRDVKGPELKRPNDKEIDMAKGGLEDYADVGTLEKHNLSDLHHGDHHSPLSASGLQDVVVPAAMGRDSAEGNFKPVTAKGAIKDQAHFGGDKSGIPGESNSLNRGVSKGSREPMPKGMGRSVAKKMEYAAKEKMKK